MLALSAWYGVNQYSASNAPSLASVSARRSGPGPGRCECALPASLRVVRMLHHVFPPPIQHRMGGAEEVPDLSQLSTAELQALLGLPDDLIPTEQEIAELQALLQENGVPLSVLMQAGQQNKAHEDELATLETASAPGDLHDAMLDAHPVMEDVHAPPPPDPHVLDAPPDPHVPDPHAFDAPVADPHAAPPPPPDPHEIPGAAAPAPPPPPPPPNPLPSMTTGSFGVPFSQAAMDAAHDVFDGANVPIAAVSNPFPQQPFPADYADYGQQFLGPAAFPLSPTSYYHPVRTFKFRLFVPTFREFFGFQFASQTIVEIYVAKKPGANQFTGIPDAFFEKKYWNVLFEVDGNKVISTMPTVLADTPAGRTAPGKDDIVAETEYNPVIGRYEPKTGGASQQPAPTPSEDYGYDSGTVDFEDYDYEQESSDYGYDSNSYSEKSNGYEYDENGYEYDSGGYEQSSSGYDYESGGNDYSSDGYGNGWPANPDDQFSRRSGATSASWRKPNKTPGGAYRRGQSRTRQRSPARGVNRMGTAAAGSRAAPARAKKRTSHNSNRRPAQSSRRPVPYGPNAGVPSRNRQSPASSRRRTKPVAAHKSSRRGSSQRRGSAPARTAQQGHQGRRPARHGKPAPAPTPPGWRPPQSTNYRSRWPEQLVADYEDNELRREAHRNQLKYKAKHGYMRRMSPERYTAWQSSRHRRS
ncbi:hypothetical protein FJT64_006214 [Amphibalanus amphitrite]|uniref:Uncharacterized protein n=2 Tax=Amphibalanus amphitrite TaxID=1232801 RepID=A0A6A4VZM5_AMPAM|nr:hypothetical protein FJT64_006214 [Amphibalanus amphitrite]